MVRNTLRDNRIILIPYLIILAGLVPIPIVFEKGQIHLFINQFHSSFFDVFFAMATYLGEGYFLIIPAIILLLISLRHFVFVVTVYFSTGLITQILKHIFDVIRPSVYLKDEALHLVEGVNLLSSRSFPSGHATSAFALFIALALIIKNPSIKVLFFILASLTAFSRVYLSQHFLVDILVGSFIGTVGAYLFYQVFYNKDRSWHAWNLKKAFGYEQRA